MSTPTQEASAQPDTPNTRKLPPWLPPEEEAALPEEYPVSFFWMFTGRAHWESFLRTGDLRRPSSIKRATREASDPVAIQREKLRKQVAAIKRSISDAAGKLAGARALLAEGPLVWGVWQAQETIKTQTARIEERQRALKSAELDVALFDAAHALRD